MMGVIVVDSDVHRRNHLAREIIMAGIHADPLEDVSELGKAVPNRLVIARDSDEMDEFFGFFERENWAPAVILYGEEPNSRQIVRAMLAGASDYLDLPAEMDSLIDRISAAQASPSPVLGARCRAYQARQKVDRLSPREKDVLHGLSEGQSNKQIASELNISHRTVEIHRSNMLGKLGNISSYEAVRMFFETRMLSEYFEPADSRAH